MTAHELARKLLDGPDLRVTVSGYEGGVDDVQMVKTPEALHVRQRLWSPFFGQHSYCSEAGPDEMQEGDTIEQAIHLEGRR